MHCFSRSLHSPFGLFLAFVITCLTSFPQSSYAVSAFCSEGEVIGCDGVCGSKKEYDLCKVCDGPGPTYVDNGGERCCEGTANSEGCCSGTKGCDGICRSGKVKDECGDCGGTGPDKTDNNGAVCCDFNEGGCCSGQKGCDNVCRSTIVDQGCGCGVTPCENCVWVTEWANWSEESSDSDSLINSFNAKKSTFTKSEKVPGCYHGEFGKCEVMNGSKDADNIIYGWCGFATALDVATFLGTTTDTAQITNSGDSLTSRYTWYMDKNCDYVPSSSNRPVCGYAGVSWSPISLIFGSDDDLTNDMRVVNFSLTADASKGYSLWKASEKAPLLVYDPTKSGQVTSAKQLFGNIAFGGITTSVADYSRNDLRATWTNGYQALALLDTNGNSKVDEAELDPVALWFDKNRNGVSEAGEVRSAKEEGITALFFKDPQSLNSRDVGLTLGFERLVDGKLTKGKSVDWYTEVFSSEKAGADALLAMANEGASNESIEVASKRVVKLDEWMREPAIFKPSVANDHSKDASGFWIWWEDSGEGQLHPGFFALSQTTEGAIRGFSIVEAMLDKNDAGLFSAVQAIPAIGSTGTNGSRRTMQFTVLNQVGNPAGVSTAEFSDDGRSLTGVTEQKAEFRKDGKLQTATVKYHWRAAKFAGKKPETN